MVLSYGHKVIEISCAIMRNNVQLCAIMCNNVQSCAIIKNTSVSAFVFYGRDQLHIQSGAHVIPGCLPSTH